MSIIDRNRALFVALSAILFIKLMVLVYLSPIHAPDTSEYIEYADLIVANAESLRSEVLDFDRAGHGKNSQTTFRVIGYPAVLAFMKAVTSEQWEWLVVSFQIVLSLIASLYVYRLALRLTRHLAIAVFILLAHGTGQTILFDQCLLSDSLNASLTVILLSYTGIAILDRRRPKWLEIFCLGVMVAAAFLMREAGLYLQMLYWPLVWLWAFSTGYGKLKPFAVLLVFALPMFVTVQAYKVWNEQRTGYSFITTTSGMSMWTPSIELAKRGVSVYESDPLLKDMEPYSHDETIVRIIRGAIWPHLVQQHGLNELEIARHATSSFFRLWRDHPGDMLRLMMRNLGNKQALLPVRPIEGVNSAVKWARGWESLLPGKGELLRNVIEDYRYDQLLMVATRAVARIVSVIITVSFVIGVPFLVIRAIKNNRLDFLRDDPAMALFLMLWGVYMGYSLLYSMVHLEKRYLLPVVPFSLLVGTKIATDAFGYLSSKKFGFLKKD
ncbi:MAG: hypothetical protein HQL36_05595 [Alphaproteobacteria bacterium]|nr:hypothetical protein [Alphaproteobacteria bacterium]MBF0249120.1 hypothetical protein [Alphaproteobacteria bacterium]